MGVSALLALLALLCFIVSLFRFGNFALAAGGVLLSIAGLIAWT